MHPRSRPFLVLLTAAALAAGHRAQEKPAPDLDASQAATVLRSAHGVAWVGGELRGAGPDYLVAFRDGGVEFVPALGRSAPRSYPLAFELESIERGGALVHAPAGPAAPELGADRVVRYARGDAIVERYETRADGVEQSFVFHEPLPGSGDLVVRGRIATDLVAQLGEHAELGFTAPELGGVRVGAVTGIDANGRTAQGSLRYDGESLELVLPGAFVDAAAYPLVLDPLIGAVIVLPSEQQFPDVAYDAVNDAYLLVCQFNASATESAVIAWQFWGSVSISGSTVYYIAAPPALAGRPTVAFVRASHRFLVAWQEDTGGSYDVKACALNAADGSVSSTIVVAGLAENEIDPDACGERTTAADGAFVVWEREDVGIFGARVAVPATGDPFVSSQTAVAVDSRVFRPKIAKSFGDAGRAMVVFNLLYSYSPLDSDVYAAVIDRDGALLSGVVPIAVTGLQEFEPDVDGDGTAWTIAYTFYPGDGSDSEIHCLRAEMAPGLVLGAASAITDDAVDQYFPAVAWTPGKSFVAWQQEQPMYWLDMDVYLKGLDPSDCDTCEPAFALDTSIGTWDSSPQLASQYSGGSGQDHVLAAWWSAEAGIGTFQDPVVKLQLLEAFGASGSAQYLGGGCGSGGTISAQGTIAAGSQDFAIHLDGADPLATTAVLILGPPATPFSCGPCDVMLSGSQLPLPLAGGAAAVTLPIPCDDALVGAQLDAQWAVLPTATGPCPALGNVGASSRLRLTLGQ